MYARRKDGNHAEIEQVFREMLADHVTDSSGWGEGAGDLFVSYSTYGCFIEIKSDEKKKLRAQQIAFANRHPDQWFRCDSVDQAINLCKIIRMRGTQR